MDCFVAAVSAIRLDQNVFLRTPPRVVGRVGTVARQIEMRVEDVSLVVEQRVPFPDLTVALVPLGSLVSGGFLRWFAELITDAA